MSKPVSFVEVPPTGLREGDMLLTDPQAPAGPRVDWRIDDIGTDREGGPVAWYTTGDGTAGTHQFEDLEQLLLVKRAGNGSTRAVRLFDRFKRNGNNGQHAADDEPGDAVDVEFTAAMAPSEPSPSAAPGTLTHPVPDSAADIDPARAPLELCASTLSAQDAVAALGADHPELPPNLPWKYHDDGAHLNLDLVAAPDEYQRGLVYLLAALLGAQPVERPRGATGGYAVLSVAGAYEGVRIAVEATVTPDPAEGLDRIYQALAERAPIGRIPELDDPTALPAVGAT